MKVVVEGGGNEGIVKEVESQNEGELYSFSLEEVVGSLDFLLLL